MQTIASNAIRRQFELLKRQPDIAFWLLCIAAAVGLFSGISTFLKVANAAHWLVEHWRDLTGWFWDWAFGWLHLSFSLAAKAQLTLVLALTLLCVRSMFLAKSISQEEIEHQKTTGDWMQSLFVIFALLVYFLQLTPQEVKPNAAALQNQSTVGKDDLIASLASIIFFLVLVLAKLYELWREMRGRPLDTERFELALRKTLSRVGSGTLILVMLNFAALFIEQLVGFLGRVNFPIGT